jgi:hypothetical protein
MRTMLALRFFLAFRLAASTLLIWDCRSRTCVSHVLRLASAVRISYSFSFMLRIAAETFDPWLDILFLRPATLDFRLLLDIFSPFVGARYSLLDVIHFYRLEFDGLFSEIHGVVCQGLSVRSSPLQNANEFV